MFPICSIQSAANSPITAAVYSGSCFSVSIIANSGKVVWKRVTVAVSYLGTCFYQYNFQNHRSHKIEKSRFIMFDIRKIQEQVIFSAVEAMSDDETAARIVYGGQQTTSAEDDATWVKSTMKRLENHFDNSAVKQIRMNCQCGHGMDEKLALVKELVDSSSSLEELANMDKAKAAGLSYANGALYLQFPFCPCPMLVDVDQFDRDTWCQCTMGYTKVLFEKAFDCDVDVELLKSVKMGDSICLQKIMPRDAVWR
jgi:hypothetical protein